VDGDCYDLFLDEHRLVESVAGEEVGDACAFSA